MDQLHQGDCLEILKGFQDDFFHSLVTDPPAGIGFMGKQWDSNKGGRIQWVDWLSSVMRECLRVLRPGAFALVWALPRTSHWTMTAIEQSGFEIRDVVTVLNGQGFPKSKDALKPACEFWVLARKPLSEKSVAANVSKWGTGGLFIEGCRIGSRQDKPQRMGSKSTSNTYGKIDVEGGKLYSEGRWPTNLILTDPDLLGDKGLYFYTAKASRQEKNEGLEGLPEAANRINAPRSCEAAKFSPQANHHPTVKPLALMRYLCRLVTPPGGVVLDCFMGSGSTGVAALAEGLGFVGIEADPDYFAIASARCQSKPSNIASK